MQQQLMILFGTGQKTPVTNTSAPTYATGTQSLYGVWDWNLTAWNSMSTALYAALPPASVGTLSAANLQAQTVTVNSSTQNRDIATNATLNQSLQTNKYEQTIRSELVYRFNWGGPVVAKY